MKICSLCQISKPFGDFYTAKTNSGLMKRCKSCASPYIRDFVDMNAPWDDDRREALRKHKSFISSRSRNKYRSNLERRRELQKLKHKAKLKIEWETDPELQASQIRVIEWAKRKENGETNNQEKTGSPEQPICCT